MRKGIVGAALLVAEAVVANRRRRSDEGIPAHLNPKLAPRTA